MAINKSKLMDSARKFSDKGQVDKAIKEYLKVVDDDPKDVRVWLKIGDLYAKKGSKEEASETYLKVAKFYGEQGFYLKAVAVYKQILKLDPRLVEVNLKLAELYRQLGLLSDAMQHFEMVAAHFHREGKTREALATIRQLVDLDPENVATRIKLAELYSKEGMTEEAVKEFAHACEFLRKQGRSDDFIKVAERLLWHKPDNLALNRELATIYIKRNDPRRALQKLQTCFKANPRDLETLAQLAQAFQALDQKAKTVSVLKEMARVLVENGQRPQAEDVHRKILAYAPSDPDSRAFLGDKADSRAAEPRSSPPAAVRREVAEAAAIAMAPAPAVQAAVLGNGRASAPNKLSMTGAMPIVQPEPARPKPAPAPAPVRAVVPAPEPVRPSAPARQVDDDFISELALDDDAAFEAESSVRGEAHSEEIAKVLTEADVYVKYGLHQKAVDHLRRVFDLDPANVEARERLKDILLAQGREPEAVAELLKLAEHAGARSPERAASYLREVLRHDGGQRRVVELAERFGLDLAEEPSAAQHSDGGEVSVVEDELEFDDLDFDAGTGAAAPVEERISARGSAGTRLPSPDDDSGGGFEFELEEEPPAVESKGDTGTVEVSIDQVEEAVSVIEPDDELEFDSPRGNLTQSIAAEPAAEGMEEEFAFDPIDARAFDADRQPIPADAGGRRSDSVGLRNDRRPAAAAPARSEPAARIAAPDDDAFAAEVDAAEVDAAEVDAAEVDESDVEELDLEAVVETGVGDVPLDQTSADPATVVARGVEGETARGDRPRGSVPPPSDELDTDGGPQAPPASLDDDLDEADFFVSQGLYAEARDILAHLFGRYPENPMIAAKLRDLEAAEGTSTESASAPDDGVIDELDSIAAVASPTADAPRAGERSRRRTGKPAVMLEKPLEDTDAETHFDLGLAYREMGLFDEAIKAFSKVRTIPGREVQSHHMIGMCHRDQGNLSEAINQFKAGLYVERITASEKFGLYYEIGTTYEQLADPQEALYYYEMVLKKDAGYRDVAQRVSALKTPQRVAATTPARPALDAETDAALDSLFDSEGRGR